MSIATKAFPAAGAALAALVLGGLTSTAALSQQTIMMDESASKCDLFRALSKTIPAECAENGASQGFKTRGIRLKQNPVASESTVVTNTATAPATSEPTYQQPAAQTTVVEQQDYQSSSVGMLVEFEYNSDRLTPQARRVLDQIADVFGDQIMANSVIMIEGHADAAGSASYNMDLSERRAWSVQRYLQDQHGFRGDRFRVVARGESEPLVPGDPYAAVNRRVEFTNLSQ